MQLRKWLIGSVCLNVILIAGIVIGGMGILDFASNFSRIPAERWRTQFDFLDESRGGTVFLGDSITEGGHWSEIFDDAAVLNRGIGGDTTQDVLERMEQVYVLQPAKLFLMIGVNDLNAGAEIPAILANYRALFDGFDARLPGTRIHVQSVLPVNRHWIGGADNADIPALNSFLSEESARRGYTFIELGPQFSDANGELREDLSNDGIHLLGAGYQVWRDAIRAHVED